MKITFDVKNQILTRTDRNQIIANSGDYLEAEITFSNDWASLEKTMTFKNGDELYTIVLANDKILQENHLNLGVGTWKASIVGIAGDQKIVTNECNVSVNASGWIGSTSIPPESVWNQLLVIIQSLHTEAASTAALRSAVQKYIEDNYDALVKEAVIVDDVRAALNDMAEDGTLSDLMSPLAAEVTGEWIAENLSQETGYVIDQSLTVSFAAADSKVVGDEISRLDTHKVNIPLDEHYQPTNGTPGQSLRTNGDGTTEWASVGLPTDEQTADAINDWLNDHPEATTTVLDGSLTDAKFSNSLKALSIKDYVTPEMFGAVGDGVSDDSIAFQNAVNECVANHKTLVLVKKYAINGISVTGRINILGLSNNDSALIDTSGSTPMLTGSEISYSTFDNFKVNFISQRSVPVFDISDSHSLQFTNLWFNALSYDGSPTIPTVKVYRKTIGKITYFTRFARCKFIYSSVYIQSTDSIISNNMFNGVYNNHALILYQSDNTVVEGNEIVPGIESAIYIDGDHNNTGLKINGNYFDGGNVTDVTGRAIYSVKTIEHSLINSNNFWHIKKEGIFLYCLRHSNVNDNVFEECGYADQTKDDIHIEKLSFAININSNNFYRKNWYYNGSEVERSAGQCYWLNFEVLPSTATYVSHIVGNIVSDLGKYNTQDYGYYYVTKYNASNNPNETTKTLSRTGVYIDSEQIPRCVIKNGMVIISGKITVLSAITDHQPFIKDCPITGRSYQGIVFNSTNTYSIYVDTNGYIHNFDTATIPTGTYYLLLQYFM